VCTATVSGWGTFVVDGSARGEDIYMAAREDFSLATRGDLEVATREDFLMATDNRGAPWRWSFWPAHEVAGSGSSRRAWNRPTTTGHSQRAW
jgi:hypothetical protein